MNRIALTATLYPFRQLCVTFASDQIPLLSTLPLRPTYSRNNIIHVYTIKSNSQHGVRPAQAIRYLCNRQAVTQNLWINSSSIPQHSESPHFQLETRFIHRLSSQNSKCLPIFLPPYLHAAAWPDRRPQYRNPRSATSLWCRHRGRRRRSYEHAVQP